MFISKTLKIHSALYRYREHHTRKFSRQMANFNLLHWLLLSSDPVVSEARGWPNKAVNPLSEEAKSLLIFSDPESEVENTDSEYE